MTEQELLTLRELADVYGNTTYPPMREFEFSLLVNFVNAMLAKREN